MSKFDKTIKPNPDPKELDDWLKEVGAAVKNGDALSDQVDYQATLWTAYRLREGLTVPDDMMVFYGNAKDMNDAGGYPTGEPFKVEYIDETLPSNPSEEDLNKWVEMIGKGLNAMGASQVADKLTDYATYLLGKGVDLTTAILSPFLKASEYLAGLTPDIPITKNDYSKDFNDEYKPPEPSPYQEKYKPPKPPKKDINKPPKKTNWWTGEPRDDQGQWSSQGNLPTDEHHFLSMRNVIWENNNPDPATICPICRELIGQVFSGDQHPVTPVHPACYCFTRPTDMPPTDSSTPENYHPDSQQTWVAYTAYLLRKGYDVPAFYESLIPQAEQVNAKRAQQATIAEPHMHLEAITPKALEGITDQELLSMHHRVHELWGQHFEHSQKETAGGLVREDLWNDHKLIAEEMKRRKMNHNVESLIDTHLANCTNPAYLPNIVTIVPQFVSIVGSTARMGVGTDVDILIRAARQELSTSEAQHLIWSDNIDIPLRKILDPDKLGHLHFIANPQGPHAESLGLYDLALVLRQSLAVTPGKSYQIMKPSMTSITDAFSVDEIWPWTEKHLSEGVYASPKMDGFRTTITSSQGHVKFYFEGSTPETPAGFEKLDITDFTIEGEFTSMKDGSWLTRQELMESLKDPSAKPHFWLYDCLYADGKDISQLKFSERLILLRTLKLGPDFEVIPQTKVTSKAQLQQQLKAASHHLLCEGLFLRTDTPYIFGPTDQEAKIKFVLELKVKVFEVTKVANGYTYHCGLSATGNDYENTVIAKDGTYVDLGSTFVSKHQLASASQILAVVVEELGISDRSGKKRFYWGKPTPQARDLDRQAPYSVEQAIDMAKRRGVFKEVKQQAQAVAPADGEAYASDETHSEQATAFWTKHWTEAVPPSGNGPFVLQHHWRGIPEAESTWDEKKLLETSHSVHADLRCSFGKALWGFTSFLGTTADVRGGRDPLTLPDDDALQGTFKLFQPLEWLTIARSKPFLVEPAGVGATSKTYAKFFEIAHGIWHMGVWREHSLEIFLTTTNFKGRFLISFVPVSGGARVWTIRRPKDQTPIAESQDKEKLLAELKQKGQSHLVWAKPGEKPEIIKV